MKPAFRSRMNVLYILIFLLAGALAGKLFFVQVVQGSSFSDRANEQYISPVSKSLKRGNIFFQRKDGVLFSAATIKSGFTIAIHPPSITNPEEVLQKLKPLLPTLNEDLFLRKAEDKNDPYEEIARHVSTSSAEKIRKQNLPGVRIFQEKWRYYPSDNLAAHVLGFVGFKGDYFGGRYGIEQYYDDSLRQEEGDLNVNFFAEAFNNIRRSFFYNDTRRKGDIVLTIEPEVERFIEEELDSIMEKWNFRTGGAIVISPKDGSIFAMAARPDFDPNAFGSEEDYAVFVNPLVENVYEPGSIVKPLTLAAGLDAGVITSDEKYYDEGYVILDGAKINNFDGKGRGLISMQTVLNKSLNTGAVYVMQKLGSERFADYMYKFGIGEETGIDLPNEVYGLVDNLKSPRMVEYATASFGQGIATTPIAMTRAFGALANDGILVTPHVGYKIKRRVGPDYKITYGGEKRVISSEASEEITRMLVEAVDEALLGGSIKKEHYSVAAKTGTAQMAKEDGNGYEKDKFLHSFFGYFPAYDPKFLIFYFIVDPQGVRYASQTLARPFMDTVEFLINYYDIPPDR